VALRRKLPVTVDPAVGSVQATVGSPAAAIAGGPCRKKLDTIDAASQNAEYRHLKNM
jgi:hypothetical protein